jgi:hypothetical protein
MHPMDFILLIVSVAAAVMSVLAQGWSLNGIGPAILLIAGGVWHFWMQWLRHRSWLRHRDSGFAPGTQHLTLAAAIGWLLGLTGPTIWIVATRIGP